MPTIHLGVIDLPYSQARQGGKASAGTETTGDVAEWLESKYNVMGVFVAEHGDDIAKAIEEAIDGAMETAIIRGLETVDFGGALDEVGTEFRRFISSGEIEGIVPGTPTQAAIDGRTSRMKRRRGQRRVSFRDTGLYINSFVAWSDPQ